MNGFIDKKDKENKMIFANIMSIDEINGGRLFSYLIISFHYYLINIINQ